MANRNDGNGDTTEDDEEIPVLLRERTQAARPTEVPSHLIQPRLRDQARVQALERQLQSLQQELQLLQPQRAHEQLQQQQQLAQQQQQQQLQRQQREELTQQLRRQQQRIEDLERQLAQQVRLRELLQQQRQQPSVVAGRRRAREPEQAAAAPAAPSTSSSVGGGAAAPPAATATSDTMSEMERTRREAVRNTILALPDRRSAEREFLPRAWVDDFMTAPEAGDPHRRALSEYNTMINEVSAADAQDYMIANTRWWIDLEAELRNTSTAVHNMEVLLNRILVWLEAAPPSPRVETIGAAATILRRMLRDIESNLSSALVSGQQGEDLFSYTVAHPGFIRTVRESREAMQNLTNSHLLNRTLEQLRRMDEEQDTENEEQEEEEEEGEEVEQN